MRKKTVTKNKQTDIRTTNVISKMSYSKLASFSQNKRKGHSQLFMSAFKNITLKQNREYTSAANTEIVNWL